MRWLCCRSSGRCAPGGVYLKSTESGESVWVQLTLTHTGKVRMSNTDTHNLHGGFYLIYFLSNLMNALWLGVLTLFQWTSLFRSMWTFCCGLSLRTPSAAVSETRVSTSGRLFVCIPLQDRRKKNKKTFQLCFLQWEEFNFTWSKCLRTETLHFQIFFDFLLKDRAAANGYLHHHFSINWLVVWSIKCKFVLHSNGLLSMATVCSS